MIFSKLCAQKALKDQQRPSFFKAWACVAADFASIITFYSLLWIITPPFWHNFSIGLIAACLFVFAFIPLQITLILSTIWAIKSRWIEPPKGDEQSPLTHP